MSSAYHHKSNGHAKCAVREVKKLLAKTSTYKDFRQALRNYRNCPRYYGLSPAQWYFGRRQRTEAVALASAYNRIPEHVIANHESQRRRRTDKKRIHANKSSRPKPPMQTGQHVIAQHLLSKRWDLRGEIIESRDGGRSYLVLMNGRRYLRNRRFLRPVPKPQYNEYNTGIRAQHHRMQTPTRTLTRAPEQHITPNRVYPQRIRTQRTHYQATIPQPKRRNRPPAR